MQEDTLILRRINTVYFFAIIFIGIYFGKERAIFCDSSMQLFDMATTKLPGVSVNMSTTVINFMLPYFAILFGFPLKIIVWLMALNYLLLPCLVFLFLRYKQESIKYEFSFLIAFSVFNWQTFFYPIHDYWTGFYLLFVLYRIAEGDLFLLNTKAKDKLLYLLILLIIFTHLSMVISIGFLFLYLFVQKSMDFKSMLRYYLFMVFILTIKIVFINSGYQNNVLDLNNLAQLSFTQIVNAKTISEFSQTLLTTNLNFTLLIGFAVVLLLFNKRKILIPLLFLIIFSSVFVIYLLFGRFGYNVYTEGYFKSTNIVTGIIIAGIFWEMLKINKVLYLVVSVNYLASVFILFNGGMIFKSQYDFINESCRKFNKSAYLKSNKDVCPMEYLAVSRQSLIINQIENNKTECIFTIVKNEPFVKKLNTKWIDDNKTNPVKYFAFSGEMVYLDADSMQFPIDSLTLIFPNKKCEDLLNRIAY